MTYDNLPVYKSTYDLLLFVFRMGSNFKREYRYTLGENLKNELINVLLCVYTANASRQKEPPLQKAREGIVVVKLQLRLLSDLKQISIRPYALAVEQAESVSKQLAAWHRSCLQAEKL